MRTLVKRVSLLMCLVILCGIVCSCELISADPDALITEAEAALGNAPYSVDMRVIYDSDDEDMKEAILSFSEPTVKMNVNNDDFSAKMEFTHDGYKSYISYAYIDKELYVKVDDNGRVTQNKISLDSFDKDEIAGAIGVDTTLGVSDFDTVKAEGIGSVKVITCTDIKLDSLTKITSSLAEKLQSIDAIVSVKDVVLAIQVKDGKYDTTILTCTYKIVTAENEYELDMTFATKFRYGSDVEVVPPFED